MNSYLEVCERAARAGGAVLLDWQPRITAREKSPRDLVTEADVASQKLIREIVWQAFPDHEFLGEEDLPGANTPPGRVAGDPPSAYRWIVDPLDGTANYVHGLNSFAVSIALEHAGRTIAGVVFDPVLGECYTAAAGEGAFLNGKPVRTSGCARLDQAMVAASFSSNVARGSPEVTRFIEVLHSTQTVRRLGSCALNLCYVASGRLDAYWTTSVKSWDVAAGMLVVAEAKGTISNLEGGPFDVDRPEFVVAATADLHRQLVEVLARV